MCLDNDGKIMLVKDGQRNTRQRKAILQILRENENPLTAEDIYLKLKEAKISISLSTVYRTLETLVTTNGALKSSVISDNKARYELNRESHRHHLICIDCSKMVAIDSCPLEQLEKTLQQNTNFDVTGHRLEIYGYCPECKSER